MGGATKPCCDMKRTNLAEWQVRAWELPIPTAVFLLDLQDRTSSYQSWFHNRNAGSVRVAAVVEQHPLNMNRIELLSGCSNMDLQSNFDPPGSERALRHPIKSHRREIDPICSAAQEVLPKDRSWLGCAAPLRRIVQDNTTQFRHCCALLA
jgi:hypothetical protein